MRMQGHLRSVKVAVAPTGMTRLATFEIGNDAVLDELQELMQQRQRLNILIEKQQLEIGDEVEGASFQGRKGVPA